MFLDNVDCIAHILSYLPVREREMYRRVCNLWCHSADELARVQQSIVVVGQRNVKMDTVSNPNPTTKPNQNSIKPSTDCANDETKVIHWPHNFIRYQCYCLMLDRFPNLRSIRFEKIDHWNDHLIQELISYCPLLTSIAFVRCVGLGQSRINDGNVLNMTFNGWSKLIQFYGNQMTTLILQDCDLDDHQLEMIVNGFRKLQHLDVSNNRITDAKALTDICDDIRVLKIGPRLLGNNVSADIPIQSVVAGAGRFVTELHLQGFLSPELSLVCSMPHLTKLVIRFMKPLFDDSNSVDYFSSIGLIPTLQCLEIYQHNTHDCYMALTKDNLSNIFNGCNSLRKFVLNSDIWCDSPLDDQVINQMHKCCPLLEYIDLCPGNFQTTNNCLEKFASFASLSYLRIVEFSGINENGLINMLRKASDSLTHCNIEDCCDINPRNFANSLQPLVNKFANRHLKLSISPLRSLHIPTEVILIPEINPRLTVTVYGQNDRTKPNSINESRKIFNTNFNVSSLVSGLLDTSSWLITVISTITTLCILFLFYLMHYFFLTIVNRFTPSNILLTIPFLSTGFYLIMLTMLVVPTVYMLSRVIYDFNAETHNLLTADTFQLYDYSTI